MRTSIEGYSQAGSVGRPQPVASSFSPQSPAAPIFFLLPLSGRTSRVLDLEPVGRSATAIGGILPLRDDSFEPKLAGVAEHGLAVALYVVIEPNAMANPGEDAGQRRLADFERIAAEGDTDWMAAHMPSPAAMAGSRMTAARVTFGAISLSTSSHFAPIPRSMRITNTTARCG